MGIEKYFASFTGTSPTVKVMDTPEFTLDRTRYDLPSKKSSKKVSTTTKESSWLNQFSREQNYSSPVVQQPATSSIKGYTPKNGDVVEIKNKGHKYGHTATYYNGGWYSDFGLKTMDPYSDSQNSSYRIFRNPNSAEAEKGASIVASRAGKVSQKSCARYVREGFNIASNGKYGGEGYNGNNFGDYLAKRGWTQIAKLGGVLKALEGIKWGSYTEALPLFKVDPIRASRPIESLSPLNGRFRDGILVNDITNDLIRQNANQIKYDIARHSALANNELKKENQRLIKAINEAMPDITPKNTLSELLKAAKEKTKLNNFANFVLGAEGGFVNDPNDKGGETYKGITLATFKRFFGKDKTVSDLKSMTRDLWQKVYNSYATDAGYDKLLNKKIGVALTDINWNGGLQNVLQRVGLSGNIKRDISSINLHPNLEQLLFDILKARDARYRAIVKLDPSLAKYLKGWLKRNNDLREYLK